MSDIIAAGRYTRALFELAEKEGRLAEIDAALLALSKILEAHPKILLLMANPTLTDQEKYGLAMEALAGEKKGLMERFLRVLIDKKRFALLSDVRKIFHDRFEKQQGIQEVELFSAAPFSPRVQEKFKTVLAKKLRSKTQGRNLPPAEIRLIAQTDRSLLGGFVLRFAGKEIDCSFKNRLHEIQQKLFAQDETRGQSL